MHTKLQRIFDVLEADRKEWLDKVSSLSDEQFKASPAPGKWSVSYILTHIMTAEQLSVLYMRKKALGVNELDNSGIIESLKLLFLKASQRIPALKFKAPKVVVEKTPESLSFEELSTKWAASRESLRKFLDSIEDKNLRKKIYKHTIVGRLDAVQALEFLREHFRHHLPQIKRLL
ncbi:MAG TPA: DinB family protein [Ohtaekwangia sp.]